MYDCECEYRDLPHALLWINITIQPVNKHIIPVNIHVIALNIPVNIHVIAVAKQKPNVLIIILSIELTITFL